MGLAFAIVVSVSSFAQAVTYADAEDDFFVEMNGGGAGVAFPPDADVRQVAFETDGSFFFVNVTFAHDATFDDAGAVLVDYTFYGGWLYEGQVLARLFGGEPGYSELRAWHDDGHVLLIADLAIELDKQTRTLTIPILGSLLDGELDDSYLTTTYTPCLNYCGTRQGLVLLGDRVPDAGTFPRIDPADP